MRPPRDIRVQIVRSVATPEEDRRLWDAINNFIESFVQDKLAILRADDEARRTGKSDSPALRADAP